MTRWNRLRSLSLAEIGELFGASLLLVAAKACLPLVRFRVAAQMPAEPRPLAPSRDDLDRAEQLAQLVGIASRRGLVRVSCLHRSLVLWWLLRRRGLGCAIHLGTKRGPGPFEAHAWVVCEGTPVGENGEHVATFHAFEQAVVPSIRISALWANPPQATLEVGGQGRFGP